LVITPRLTVTELDQLWYSVTDCFRITVTWRSAGFSVLFCKAPSQYKLDVADLSEVQQVANVGESAVIDSLFHGQVGVRIVDTSAHSAEAVCPVVAMALHELIVDLRPSMVLLSFTGSKWHSTLEVGEAESAHIQLGLSLKKRLTSMLLKLTEPSRRGATS
jgi:hypothetical protein